MKRTWFVIVCMWLWMQLCFNRHQNFIHWLIFLRCDGGQLPELPNDSTTSGISHAPSPWRQPGIRWRPRTTLEIISGWNKCWNCLKCLLFTSFMIPWGTNLIYNACFNSSFLKFNNSFLRFEYIFNVNLFVHSNELVV